MTDINKEFEKLIKEIIMALNTVVLEILVKQRDFRTNEFNTVVQQIKQIVQSLKHFQSNRSV